MQIYNSTVKSTTLLNMCLLYYAGVDSVSVSKLQCVILFTVMRYMFSDEFNFSHVAIKFSWTSKAEKNFSFFFFFFFFCGHHSMITCQTNSAIAVFSFPAGISAEERAVLSRTHRQLCDAVLAEDIIDRLVQGHVISLAEKQEILTPRKNQDRMQILLSKVNGQG